ncbi:dual specificity protein phosphatase 22-A isoform X2 [Myxocyprinus asiaticus]|uniref:dual specificity protein phosphatase 22-A isoform X2 n=1 Tax=Myxocyprinus asiaticus TaxID=70543 RepID=UPI0022237763|nr:dual specificity protein phosphatase 22-A isoform X2 [Myxocyprinus asiaticus]XP_051512606.1 dual specificity protein phosphatase 22-A isoform X2 [Myxocyprinus asiaticus]
MGNGMNKDMTYLCINAADASSQNLSQHFKESIRFIHECRLNGGACLVHCLAGVSRSTTMVVAYLMTVTSYGWEECLTAVKAVRSFVGPNYGFQQQLQEFQMKQASEYRAWLRASYSASPFKDQEQVEALLSLYAEQQQQGQQNEPEWMNRASRINLPYNQYSAPGSNR